MRSSFALKPSESFIFKTSMLLMLVFVIIFSSISELRDAFADKTYIKTGLYDSITLAVKAITRKNEDTFYLLDTIASFIGQDTAFDDKNLNDSLRKLAYGKDFYTLEVADSTGKAYCGDGTKRDISKQEYFMAAKAGERAVTSLAGTGSDEGSVVFSLPIYNEDGFAGMVACYYHRVIFEKMLSDYIEEFGVSASSWVIQDSGTPLLSCGNTYGYSNFYELLHSGIVIEKSPEDFAAQVKRQKEGYIRFKLGSIGYYAVHMPIGQNGWTLVTVVPSKVIDENPAALSVRLILLLKLMLVFAAVALYIFSFERNKAAKIRQSRQEFEALTNNVPGGVFRYRNDEKQTLGYLSEGLLHMYGYTLEIFRRMFDNSFINMVYAEDRMRVQNEIAGQLAQNGKRKIQYRIIDASGKIRWVYDSGRIVTDKDGNEWFYVVLIDVTRFKNREEQVRESEERYRILVEETNSIVLESNSIDGTAFFTPNFKERFGFEPKVYDSPSTLFPWDMIHADDLPKLEQMRRQMEQGANTITDELRIRTGDGEYLWYQISHHIVRDEKGLPIKTISRITDIDADMRQRVHLEDLTQRDPLTGLYNKAAVKALISEYLRLYGNSGLHALLFVDIDNFKAVNDNLGHLIGDQVIIEIGSRLPKPFRETDIVGRVGGDEFVVFLKNVRTKRFVYDKAEQICNIFRNAYIGENGSYKISGSIGIAFSNGANTTYEVLVEEADQALYSAKAHGKDHYEVYHQENR